MLGFIHMLVDQTVAAAACSDPNPASGFGPVCDLTKHPPRRPCHHMLTIVQLPYVLADVGSPDAGVTLDIHIVS